MNSRSATINHRLLAFLLLAGAALLEPSLLRLEANEPAAKGEDDRSEASERRTILNSDAWRRSMEGLDEWLSAQPIYDPKQIAELRKQLADRANKMSPDELEAFRHDLDAKLAMALGPEGRDILNWVMANLAAASPAYRKQLGLDYPDLLKLTAAQFREQLDLIQRKRSAAQNQSAAFEQARQARIASLQSEQRQEYDERQRALDRAAASRDSSAYHSPYHPGGARKYHSEYIRAPFYGWGWGFGFW
jgi:hypothetical protein